MKLSIVVVNYNVKYFLQQLLLSLFQSKVEFDFEIIIVDNNSQDGSIPFLQKQFPGVKYLTNDENLGFAKASNQGIRSAIGDYVLLLNPDTLLREDTLSEAVAFMEGHPQAGAIGVKMVDGAGRYLPESKRGFPSPGVAFNKLIGLNKLFPKSKFFNGYYLGHLDSEQSHEIDVLTGAFMLIRRSVLDQVGLLDEDYFMYGEDIDLSYRIRQAGYKIYYTPASSIVHFKGESTDKNTLEYVRRFYSAMKIFARKHYSGSRASILRMMLNLSIYSSAAVSVVQKTLHSVLWPLIDFLLIFAAFGIIKELWALYYFRDPLYYDQSRIQTNFLLYSSIWVITFFLSGVYDRISDIHRLIRSGLVGGIMVVTLYSLFGSSFRPSRAILILGSIAAFLLLLIFRWIWLSLARKQGVINSENRKKLLVVGDESEVNKVVQIMNANGVNFTLIGRVSPGEDFESNSVGNLSQLDQIVRFYETDEIIFCSKNIPASEIMRWMSRLGSSHYVKIAPDKAESVLGSRNKNFPGDLHTFEVKYNIADPVFRRSKRLLDIGLSLLFTISLPALILVVRNRLDFIQNIWAVAAANKTWVSYSSPGANLIFPPLQPGILRTLEDVTDRHPFESLRNADYYYARDYGIVRDLEIIFRNIKDLGGNDIANRG